jgi:hypothetical protein
MHGQHHLVTDVLKGTMGFDGLVVSDWDAIDEVQGCSRDRCGASQVWPALTTIRQPIPDMAAKAAELLVSILRREPPHPLRPTPQLNGIAPWFRIFSGEAATNLFT